VKVFVISAGLVGATVVEALHRDHDVTVVDLAPDQLRMLAERFDVATVQATAVSRRELIEAGLRDAQLVIACTSRDEANLVAGAFARAAAPQATTIIRTSRIEYVELWREGHLDADFVVSSELETARAVSSAIGMPAARHCNTFADGQVQVVELDVGPTASSEVVTRKLRDVTVPGGSRVACIIREGRALLPKGDAVVRAGDRLIVIGSPGAAHAWSDLVAPRRGDVRDVVVFGAQELGSAIAGTLVGQGLDVRVVEPDAARAAQVAQHLPQARVFNATGLDATFLQREGIARVQAAVFAMRDDARNLFAATLARVHGVSFTIALAHEAAAADVYERGGIDVTIDPGRVTADEILRFAHDPRTKQLSTLEHDRFVILDITTRPESEYVGLSLREMPIRDALIGALVRDGRAMFPRSEDVLRAGDRVIVFTEASRAPEVERVL
jgi:trk system potassium uptake protein TrkA